MWGMGALGWSEEQTLQTTLPAIELAYRGRCEFVSKIIGAVFGNNEPAPPPVSPRPFSFALFDAQFGGD
jgi:hypothetical protein